MVTVYSEVMVVMVTPVVMDTHSDYLNTVVIIGTLVVMVSISTYDSHGYSRCQGFYL